MLRTQPYKEQEKERELFLSPQELPSDIFLFTVSKHETGCSPLLLHLSFSVGANNSS